jgi:hypothetical protein
MNDEDRIAKLIKYELLKLSMINLIPATSSGALRCYIYATMLSSSTNHTNRKELYIFPVRKKPSADRQAPATT